jgi:hypothetical protein
MTIRQIFYTDTRSAILLRGIIAVCIGLLVAGIWSVATDSNAFKVFAFPIFGIPVILTVIKLLLTLGTQSREQDRRRDA